MGNEFLLALPLGFLVGMSHALEADHLAAVTTLARARDGWRRLMFRGAFWGVGHSISLLIMSCAVIFLGITISASVEAALEAAVGLMIAALGAHVIWRLRREHIHIHAHEHGGRRHLHFHRHARGEPGHDHSHAHAHAHDHAHGQTALSGSGMVLSVGLVHGLAGSAGFIVLLSATADTVTQALSYLAAFAAGSIFGMGALTAILSLPLGQAQKAGGWVPVALRLCIAAAALVVGISLTAESLTALASPLE